MEGLPKVDGGPEAGQSGVAEKPAIGAAVGNPSREMEGIENPGFFFA